MNRLEETKKYGEYEQKISIALDRLAELIKELCPGYVDSATIDAKTVEEYFLEQENRIWTMILALNKGKL